jgi:hypothetical protein
MMVNDPNLISETIFTAPSEDHLSNESPSIVQGEKTSIIRFPDGTAVVGPNEDESSLYPNRLNPDKHDENLALILDENELRDIGNSLKFSVEEDIESQTQFFESIAKIIEYLGLTLTSESDKEDLPFKGATSIYSPAMFESALDLISSTKTSIFPSSNMVDTIILGEANQQLQDIAYRKKSFFNYYFDNIAKEFRKEAIRTIFWATIAGSAYKKVYICPVIGRPVSNFIPIEDFIVNREHSSHLASNRKTHILRIKEREFRLRVMSGIYRDISIMKQEDRTDNTNVIQEQLDQLSGYESSNHNYNDNGYKIYECHVDYRIKGDNFATQYDIPLPYIISIDSESGKVLAIRRNWKEDDPLKKKREYFVNYSLLPSLDGEGYGLVNYAGRLTEAATSLTRQLINAGTYANFPGGVYQQGIRLENNNLRPAPGEFVPIQTGGIPVGQAIESLPYKEPSQALLALKNEIEDNIRKPSAIINQKITDLAPRAPQGSVLLMLENLHKIPNAIMQSFHESFTIELELFNDRFAEWLPDGQPYPFMVPGGNNFIMKEDFNVDIQVKASSDPSTQNSAHRFLVSEIVINKAREAPDIHNMDAVFRYFYKNVGLSEEEINKLLSKNKEQTSPQPLDPVSTIMALTQGEPTTAAVWQNHDAYITIIDLWIQQNPQNPNIPAAQALKAQHEAMKYMVDIYAKLNIEPPKDPSQITPEQQNQLAIAVAQIKMQEAQESAAQAGPPPEPPLDPARVMMEDSLLKAQTAHEKHQLEYQKIQLENQKNQMEFFIKEQEFNLKTQIQTLKQALDEKKSQMELMKITHEQELKERDQLLKEKENIINKNYQSLPESMV